MTAIWRIIAFGLALGLVIAVALLAYKERGPDIDLKGKWIGFRKFEVPEGADRIVVRNLAKVEVRIDGNGRFVLFERGLPKSGKVRYSDGKAILDIAEVAGRSLERQPESVRSQYGPVELTIKDPNQIEYRDPMLLEEPITLNREPQPAP